MHHADSLENLSRLNQLVPGKLCVKGIFESYHNMMLLETPLLGKAPERPCIAWKVSLVVLNLGYESQL